MARDFLSRFKRSAGREPVPAEPTDGVSGDRYRSVEFTAFPVGDQIDLIHAPGTGPTRVLPAELVELLHRCSRFATLDEHARARCHELGLTHDHVASLARQLGELARAGLMISCGELLERCRPAAAPNTAPVSIASVGVVTRNRPESLERGLLSYIENTQRHSRTVEFAVMDDSEDPELRESTRERLRALQTRCGVRISYAGLEEKTGFAAALAKEASAPPEVIRFALFDPEGCGRSVGANHNGHLLHTVGDAFFSADDDTLCRIAAPSDTADGLACVSQHDPREFWFFNSREEALGSVQFVEADLLALHERLLGRQVASCVVDWSATAAPDLDLASARFLRRIASGRGRVCVTMNGLIGDSGMGSPRNFITLSGASRERLLESESIYRGAFTSREVRRATSRHCIGDGVFCMTTFLGLDNRVLLPPFFPVQRNTDGIFGTTLASCLEDGYFGFLPSMLVHAPMESRLFSGSDSWKHTRATSVDEVVQACIVSLEFGPTVRGDTERLRTLGQHLTALGAIPRSDFEEFLRIQLWRRQTAYISLLEERLRSYDGLPTFWAEDVRRVVSSLQDSLASADYIVPRDLVGARDADEARELMPRLLQRFGELLSWWPALAQSAGALRARGQRLAEPL